MQLKRFAMVAIWGLLVLAGLFVVVRFSGLIDHMLPAGDPPNSTFDPGADVPQSNNFFIACPDRLVPKTDRKMQSPVFDAAASTLADLLIETAPAHGMTLMRGANGAKPGKLYFLARSPVFHFPDWVEVELVLPETGNEVTFCMFAQSVYGSEDLGQNEKRTRAWIADVTVRMGQAG